MRPPSIFQEFLIDRDVAAVRPSSSRLVRRVLRHVPKNADRILEIGPGPGTVTLPLLARLPSDARYLAVERNPRFADHLERLDDPRLTVVRGDARRLGELLAGAGGAADDGFDVVLASMPFSRITRDDRLAVTNGMRDALRAGGVCIVFHQYTPLMLAPMRKAFGPVHIEFELLNFLPCVVLTAKK